MIAKLKGTIDELKPTSLILDVRGVGYDVGIPLSTYEKIQNEKDITLYIHTLHKEDQLKLFGFYTEQEKSLFVTLLDISGIGPSMAISIISGISISRLIEAVNTESTGLLTKIPGIGTTKAEKLIFELKRKIKKIEQLAGGENISYTPNNDAVEALVALGFDESKSFTIVNEILQEDQDTPLENIIKEALKQLSL